MSKRSRSSSKQEEAAVAAPAPAVEEEEEEPEYELVEVDGSDQEEASADSFAAGPFLLGSQAPDFAAKAVVEGKIDEDFVLSELRGKWVVALFYPLNWTFVCPTELVALSDRIAEFEQINAEVVAISVDSVESHLAWSNVARKDGGLGAPLAYPLVSDLSGGISEAYGARWLAGHSCRATYLIDPEGTIKHVSLSADAVGRNVDEILRLLTAFQYAAEHPGEGCPIGWTKGQRTIKTDPVGSKEYFAATASKKK